MAYAFLSVFLFFTSLVSAMVHEKPYMLWLGIGGGIAYEDNEQYSPLIHNGSAFRFTGGWAIRGKHFLWNGQLAYATTSLKSSQKDDFQVKSEQLAARTSIYSILPINLEQTTIALGLSSEAIVISTNGGYLFEVDYCENKFLSFGPSLLIENNMFNQWKFILIVSCPLKAYMNSPLWVNGAAGKTHSEWITIPDFLNLETTLCAGRRYNKTLEVLFYYTYVAQQHKVPFTSERMHHYIGIGFEIDLGEKQ
jgi:hypothetical protein